MRKIFTNEVYSCPYKISAILKNTSLRVLLFSVFRHQKMCAKQSLKILRIVMHLYIVSGLLTCFLLPNRPEEIVNNLHNSWSLHNNVVKNKDVDLNVHKSSSTFRGFRLFDKSTSRIYINCYFHSFHSLFL